MPPPAAGEPIGEIWFQDGRGAEALFCTAEGKKGERRVGGNVASAKAIGKEIADRAKALLEKGGGFIGVV